MGAFWVGCECRLPERCPYGFEVKVEQRLRGMWTEGHVHHHQKRSRRPDLREDHANLRLVHLLCHDLKHP
jgi:hypothetical protein